MEFDDRIIAGAEQEADGWQYSLRPRLLNEYIGQTQVKDNLSIFIKAAAARHEALDHVLLFGPPGLGKTTLANIIANELNVNIRVTSGPAIERQGDLAAILTNLGDNDVLFIDEIHRLSKTVEEILYSAMEDFALDIIIGKGPAARSVRLDLPHFTLIGATTRLGAIAAPLRDRFGVQCCLEFYKPEELQFIITRAAEILNVKIDKEGAMEIARRSRGTPRIANRLLKRVRDFAQVLGVEVIDRQLADEALAKLEVDRYGFDRNDRKILTTIVKTFGGGPVGIETIAAAVSEESSTIEDVIAWAPALRYHDGKFWMFVCTPNEGLFMSTATDPAGPWSPLHCVKSVSGWEDPCPFWDDNGQAFLGRSQLGAGPIILHKMSPDGKSLLDDGTKIYEGPVAEGTKLFKKDGLYYLSIPEGGVGTGWQDRKSVV